MGIFGSLFGKKEKHEDHDVAARALGDRAARTVEDIQAAMASDPKERKTRIIRGTVAGDVLVVEKCSACGIAWDDMPPGSEVVNHTSFDKNRKPVYASYCPACEQKRKENRLPR